MQNATRGGAKGGGVYLSTGTASFTSSILAGNTKGATASDCEKESSASVTAGNSLLQATGAGACGLTATNGNLIGQDPLLGALANNGCHLLRRRLCQNPCPAGRQPDHRRRRYDDPEHGSTGTAAYPGNSRGYGCL